jgi:hypothetical protein
MFPPRGFVTVVAEVPGLRCFEAPGLQSPSPNTKLTSTALTLSLPLSLSLSLSLSRPAGPDGASQGPGHPPGQAQCPGGQDGGGLFGRGIAADRRPGERR